jgi:hypothetical protein
MRGEPALDHRALACRPSRGSRRGCQCAGAGAITAGRPQSARECEFCASAVVGCSRSVKRDRALEEHDGLTRIAVPELGLAEARKIVGQIRVVGAVCRLVDGARTRAYPQRIGEPPTHERQLTEVGERNRDPLVMTPARPSVPAGHTQQFVATGMFGDGTTRDLTDQAAWASSMTAVAQISNADGSRGLATGLTTGTTDISATLMASSIRQG